MFDPVAFIAEKRAGARHSDQAIRDFVEGLVAGRVADYQASAWAMAVCFNGLDRVETGVLADAIARSGTCLRWPQLDAPVVDKHSTGGVGDKTSLVVAPLAAACGLAMPKLSGRGLGITGGTLDKLESIPGLRVALDPAALREQVAAHGLAIAAQSSDIAPADEILYALRDVTATIDSIPLIAASVMGKKLAGGAATLALDVKCGRGAFLPELDDAMALATLMADIGSAAGVTVRAYVSAMEVPLGRAIGNSIEVAEAIEVLEGRGPAELAELALTIVAGLLRDSGARPAPRAAREIASRTLASGKARAKFAAMIAAQGGELDRFLADPPHASCRRVAVPAREAGTVTAIDARRIGTTVRSMGGGRRRKGEAIDHGVGVLLHAGRGETVAVGETLAEVLVRDRGSESAAEEVAGAFTISGQLPAPSPLILAQVVRPAPGAGQ